MCWPRKCRFSTMRLDRRHRTASTRPHRTRIDLQLLHHSLTLVVHATVAAHVDMYRVLVFNISRLALARQAITAHFPPLILARPSDDKPSPLCRRSSSGFAPLSFARRSRPLVDRHFDNFDRFTSPSTSPTTHQRRRQYTGILASPVQPSTSRALASIAIAASSPSRTLFELQVAWSPRSKLLHFSLPFFTSF